MLVDSHCHLDSEELILERAAIFEKMQSNGVDYALTVGTTWPTSQDLVKWVETMPNLVASIGVHPDSPDYEDPSDEDFIALAAHPKVVAIGETGLDYHWCEGDLTWQHERFRQHIRVAQAAGLPIIVHTRDAADDTLRIMRECHAEKNGGVIHCFTQDWAFAEQALDMGFYISFSGIVTFKNAKDIQEVAARMPLDRLLIETDSPYLAPVPFRGKLNQPGYVKHVAEYISTLRSLPFKELAQVSTENFFNLFTKARVIRD